MQWSDRIGRRLKLRDLHILLAVVQHRSMVKAASELAISPPAISKAIADIEHTVGLRLLDRSRNGIEPTAYGSALVRRGVAIFDELKQGVRELESLADPTAGELRIGSSESMAAGILPAVIDRFSRRYPRVHLDVAQVVFAPTQYHELRERRVDLLFGRISPPLPEDDLESEVIFKDRVVVVAGRQSPWARARRIDLADLLHEAWILPPSDSFPHSLTEEIFRAHGLGLPRAPLTTLSVHLCCRLLATGRFVTTLPTSILNFSGKDLSLKLLPVRLPDRPRAVEIAIVKLKNRTLNPVAQQFIECARAVANPKRDSRRS
jgi:DNA-binding transcriptional LysR family regulator